MAKSTAKRGLGRGFDSLLPKNLDISLVIEEGERIHQIKLDLIEPNSNQPRRTFELSALNELADSIKEHGVLQPIIVTPKDNDEGYIIIAGERRWRAAKIAGLAKIPAVIRSSRELERIQIALVENVQRVDLSPLDQALTFDQLHNQFNMSVNSIAQRLGKAYPTINNILRLLQLPDHVKEALAEGKITEGHARSLLSLMNYPEKQTELMNSIIKNGWSVRQAERFVTVFKSTNHSAETKEIKKRMQTSTPQTKRLSEKLNTPVSIRLTAHGGKLEIEFKSTDDLRSLLKRLLKLK
ncbi:MAG TPA: ParB/RepB/Spo0J family partition protein [Patescibacteria group bacterium]|jgi:ParB family chromosome partitioning protein|nr:ParB/RepB/Spo0J family partition protein [Patescibacteria group bacterium]